MLPFTSRILNTVVFMRHAKSYGKLSTRIVDIEKNFAESAATIKGWVRGIRKLKDVIFIDVNDGSCAKALQVVLPKKKIPENLSYGSSVEIEGTLLLNKQNQYELSAMNVKMIGDCQLCQGYPFAPKKSYPEDYIRQYLHLRPRTSKFSSLLRIRHYLSLAVHTFFQNKGYFFVHTPILTSNDCEGAGEVFQVSYDDQASSGAIKSQTSNNFFGSETYLTVSGQLHLEAIARSLGQVYNFGPVFRAENSKSRLHLSEFYMIEAETSFLDSVEDLTSLCETFLVNITKEVISTCYEDILNCRRLKSSKEIDQVPFEVLVKKQFNTLTYNEASEIIERNNNKLKTKFEYGCSLTKEQELFLVKHNGGYPLFVIDWPRVIKPFYMKPMPTEKDKVMAFDLLCPNVGELCGGSIRNDDWQDLKDSLKENESEKLEWYLQLREFGNVPSGGFGLGFERYLQVLLNIENIKDTIPFPRWPHNCKL